jgi:hypothetical protein
MGLVLDGFYISLIVKSDRFCQVIDTAKSELSGVVKDGFNGVIDTAKSELSGVVKDGFNGVIDTGKVRFAVSLTPVRNSSALLLTL